MRLPYHRFASAPAGRGRDVTRRRHDADLAGVAAVLLLTALGAWGLVADGTVVGQDSAAFFYPMYDHLGERLRAGDLPGWSPHQFGGAPFAGDPESGWTYLPAMTLFTALPLWLAAKVFVVLHLAMAGLATYALARVLGMGVIGALAAAVAYEFNGLVYGRAVCCPAYLQVAAWLPVLILGAELALRATPGGWLARARGWALGGLALSQILASWLGQGAGYALLVFGGFLAYRTLIDPRGAGPRPSLVGRLGRLAGHGASTLGIGFGLAAAGLLPRLAFHSRSNLAEGYQGDLAWAADLGGWTTSEVGGHLLGRGLYYAGGATLVLAVVGVALAGRRFAAPAWAGLTVGALVLAAGPRGPFQPILAAVVPPFAELHRHWPERVAVVLYLGPALLAGATVTAIADRGDRGWRGPWRSTAGLPALVLVPGLLDAAGIGDLPGPTGPAAVGVGLLLAVGLSLPSAGTSTGSHAVTRVSMPFVIPWRRAAVTRRATGPVVAAALVGVMAADLLASGQHAVAHNNWYGGFHRVDLDAYSTPTGAAAFLRDAQGQAGPFRYFGYDPSVVHVDPTHGQQSLYRYQYADPQVGALLVNNRATLLGLEDVQGYNPLQVRRYVELVKAMNGHPQEYHGAYVHAAGLNSPLLDLLNARYVVVPAAVPPDRPDLAHLAETLPQVYADADVRVLERPSALPRAWVVHDARQAAAGEALGQLAGGAIDPRRTVLLESAPPALAVPADPAADRAEVVRNEPDRLTVRAGTDAAGMLVLSQVYDPGWRAYVDGARAPLHIADHALMAVGLPPGEHEVELRYEPPGLRLGLAVSGATATILLAVLLGGPWLRRRRWVPLRRP